MKNTQNDNSRPLYIYGMSNNGRSIFAELMAKEEAHIVRGSTQIGKSNFAELVQNYLDQNPK